jgi:hypothetical protein
MIRGDGDTVYVKYALRARRLKVNVPPVRITGVAARVRDFIEESIWVVLGYDASGSQVAQGTAFHLEGVGMVTASHVLSQPAVPVAKWCLLSMRPPYSTANIVGYVANPHLDMAIIKTDAFLSGSLRASVVDPEAQDPVCLVGYPNWHSLGDHSLMGEWPIVQTKVMSGLRYSSVGYPLLSGASGAPVLNLDGQVVGVVVHSSGHLTFANAFVAIAHVDIALAGQHHALWFAAVGLRLIIESLCQSYPYPQRSTISKYRQNAFAILICSGVRHSGSNSAGEHTKMLSAFARDVATFNRFKE